jgi:hypothetical protein
MLESNKLLANRFWTRAYHACSPVALLLTLISALTLGAALYGRTQPAAVVGTETLGTHQPTLPGRPLRALPYDHPTGGNLFLFWTPAATLQEPPAQPQLPVVSVGLCRVWPTPSA